VPGRLLGECGDKRVISGDQAFHSGKNKNKARRRKTPEANSAREIRMAAKVDSSLCEKKDETVEGEESESHTSAIIRGKAGEDLEAGSLAAEMFRKGSRSQPCGVGPREIRKKGVGRKEKKMGGWKHPPRQNLEKTFIIARR